MPLEVSILVVSGDQDVADFLSRQMLVLGCRSVAVSRHNQAISASDAHDFHLALVMERLEDGSGLDVVAALRRRHPHLTVYLVVSKPDEQVFAQARRCGATRCVVRPTHGSAVESLLEDALESSRATADLECGDRRAAVVE